MGIVFRQSIKTAIVTLFGALVGAYLTYLTLEFLTPQEYGFTRDLLTQAVVGSQLILMGFHTTLFVLIERYPPGSKGRPILISLSVLVPFLLTLFFGLLFVAFKPVIVGWYQAQDMALVEKYLLWLPVYVLFWGWMIVLEHYLTSQMKVAASIFMREVLLRLLNLALIVLYAIDLLNFELFIALSVLVHIVPVGILYLIARTTQDFRFSFDWRSLSRGEYKSILDFAFFHALLNLSISLMGFVDVLMVGRLDRDGLKAAAIYGTAVYVISIFEKPYRALATAATPVLNRAYEQKDMDKVRELYTRSGINILVVSIGMAAIVLCNMPNAVRLIGEYFAPATPLVAILLIGKLTDAATGLNNELLSVSNHYRFNFYITCCLVVTLVGALYFLIPIHGIYGAAWSTSLIICAFNIIKMTFLWKKMQIHPFSKLSILVVLAGVVACGAGYFLPYMLNPYVDTIIRTGVILVLYVILVFILKLSPDLNSFLRSVKTNKKLF